MLYSIHTFFYIHGWKGVYSLFFKVYWCQDIFAENNGYDVILLKKDNKHKHYYYGTYNDRIEKCFLY